MGLILVGCLGRSVPVPIGSELLPVSSNKRKPHVMLNGGEYKHCSKCGTWRPLERFNFAARPYDKLQAWCRSCMRDSVPKRKKIAGKV